MAIWVKCNSCGHQQTTAARFSMSVGTCPKCEGININFAIGDVQPDWFKPQGAAIDAARSDQGEGGGDALAKSKGGAA